MGISVLKYARKGYAAMGGLLTANSLIKHNPKSKMISTYSGVGDRVFTLSYLREYQKRNHINDIKIISADPYNAVYQYFDIKKEEILPVKREKMLMLNDFYTMDIGCHFRHIQPEILSVSVDVYVRSELFSSVEFVDYSHIVKAIYKLPQETKPAACKKFPLSKRTKQLIASGVIVPEKTVVMNPYANSCRNIPFSFFQKIANHLAARGYQVISSAIKGQKALENTYGLDFDLIEAISLCEICGTVIGARSGFMDLISFSEANIISIDNLLYPHKDLFLLEKCWKNHSRIKTYHWCKEDETRIAEQVIDRVIRCGS